MDVRPFGNSPAALPKPVERAQPDPVLQAAGRTSEADAAPASGAGPAPKPHAEEVTQALKSINALLQSRSPDLEFSVDHDSERTIVKVVDTKTHEVIRQMPTREALDIAKALDRLQSMLIRQSA